MDTIVGVVRQGVVAPESPLPEGAKVQITLLDSKFDIPPELQEEFDAWERASSEALELTEKMAEEDGQK